MVSQTPLVFELPWGSWESRAPCRSPSFSLQLDLLPSGNIVLPLLQATKEKILKGEFGDLFFFLYRSWRKVKKDKEQLDDREKEILNCRKVDHTRAN